MVRLSLAIFKYKNGEGRALDLTSKKEKEKVQGVKSVCELVRIVMDIGL